MPEVLTTLATKAAPRRTALVLVDMCNDFVHPEGKTSVRARGDVSHVRRVIPTVRRLLEGARAAGLLVVYAQHTTRRDNHSDSGPWIEARSRATYSVVDLCVEGTWGQQIIDELTPQPSDVVIQKYRYSAFAGTNLELVLRAGGIRTVICAGVSTNLCVEATAREAFSAEFYVVMPQDACGSWWPALHDATLESARHGYAEVCDVDDLLAEWAPPSFEG